MIEIFVEFCERVAYNTHDCFSRELVCDAKVIVRARRDIPGAKINSLIEFDGVPELSHFTYSDIGKMRTRLIARWVLDNTCA